MNIGLELTPAAKQALICKTRPSTGRQKQVYNMIMLPWETRRLRRRECQRWKSNTDCLPIESTSDRTASFTLFLRHVGVKQNVSDEVSKETRTCESHGPIKHASTFLKRPAHSISQKYKHTRALSSSTGSRTNCFYIAKNVQEMRAHIEKVTLVHESFSTSTPVKWRTLHRSGPSEQRCLSGTVDYARDEAREAKWPISCKMFTICYIDPLLHPRAKNLRGPPL